MIKDGCIKIEFSMDCIRSTKNTYINTNFVYKSDDGSLVIDENGDALVLKFGEKMKLDDTIEYMHMLEDSELCTIVNGLLGVTMNRVNSAIESTFGLELDKYNHTSSSYVIHVEVIDGRIITSTENKCEE